MIAIRRLLATKNHIHGTPQHQSELIGLATEHAARIFATLDMREHHIVKNAHHIRLTASAALILENVHIRLLGTLEECIMAHDECGDQVVIDVTLRLHYIEQRQFVDILVGCAAKSAKHANHRYRLCESRKGHGGYAIVLGKVWRPSTLGVLIVADAVRNHDEMRIGSTTRIFGDGADSRVELCRGFGLALTKKVKG